MSFSSILILQYMKLSRQYFVQLKLSTRAQHNRCRRQLLLRWNTCLWDKCYRRFLGLHNCPRYIGCMSFSSILSQSLKPAPAGCLNLNAGLLRAVPRKPKTSKPLAAPRGHSSRPTLFTLPATHKLNNATSTLRACLLLLSSQSLKPAPAGCLNCYSSSLCCLCPVCLSIATPQFAHFKVAREWGRSRQSVAGSGRCGSIEAHIPCQSPLFKSLSVCMFVLACPQCSFVRVCAGGGRTGSCQVCQQQFPVS
jgi:hypothetical protein